MHATKERGHHMGHCKRPRTREFAPTNSGSRTKPERINLRCTTEQCGRALSAVSVAREVRRMRNPKLGTNVSDAFHHVIIHAGNNPES